MSHPRPQLPQGVVDIILAQVDDKETLADCSLVCRSWVPSARRALFETVTLKAGSDLAFDFEEDKGEKESVDDENLGDEDEDDDDDVDEENWEDEHEADSFDEKHETEYWGFQRMLAVFTVFMTANADIASNVRTLHIEGQLYTETNLGFSYPVTGSTLRDMVAALPGLRVLSLSTLTLRDMALPPISDHASLRTLILDDLAGLDCEIDNERQLKDVLQLLVLFPSLRELDFDAEEFLFEEGWLRPVANSKLTSFRQRQHLLGWGDDDDEGDDDDPPRLTSYRFLASLIRATGRKGLHLDIDMVLPEYSPGYPHQLLKHVGPQLESLTLRPWWDPSHHGPVNERNSQDLGLCFCPSLRTIRFDFDSRFNPTVIGPLADIGLMHCVFKELFTNNCKNLTVIFDLPTSYKYKGSLTEIDKYAVKFVRQGFVKLVLLERGQRLTAGAEKTMRLVMPKLNAKGVLAFME